MAVKIRLQRKGRKKAPFYFIVVADTRSPRDGKCIERIGSYNPIPKLAQVEVDVDKAVYWLNQGATPTKTVRSLLSKQGVLFKKHLLRGVQMGILSMEDAELKFGEFIKEKADKSQKVLEKVKSVEDKAHKSQLENEAKINEKRVKELMEKRQAELKKKHAEKHPEEEITEEVSEEVSEEVVAEEVSEDTVSEEIPDVSEEEAPAENTEEEK